MYRIKENYLLKSRYPSIGAQSYCSVTQAYFFLNTANIILLKSLNLIQIRALNQQTIKYITSAQFTS